MPTLGLAVLAAWGVVEAWKARWYAKTAVVLLTALYLASSIPVGRAVTRWNYQRSRASRNLVQGLIRAHELHPGKVILLTGVSSDLFWSTLSDKAHWLVEIRDVYLVPGSEANIEAAPEVTEVSDYVLPSVVALRALEQDRAVVYSADGERLRNVTSPFPEHRPPRWGQPELPVRVEVGNRLFSRTARTHLVPHRGHFSLDAKARHGVAARPGRARRQTLSERLVRLPARETGAAEGRGRAWTAQPSGRRLSRSLTRCLS